MLSTQHAAKLKYMHMAAASCTCTPKERPEICGISSQYCRAGCKAEVQAWEEQSARCPHWQNPRAHVTMPQSHKACDKAVRTQQNIRQAEVQARSGLNLRPISTTTTEHGTTCESNPTSMLRLSRAYRKADVQAQERHDLHDAPLGEDALRCCESRHDQIHQGVVQQDARRGTVEGSLKAQSCLQHRAGIKNLMLHLECHGK